MTAIPVSEAAAFEEGESELDDEDEGYKVVEVLETTPIVVSTTSCLSKSIVLSPDSQSHNEIEATRSC